MDSTISNRRQSREGALAWCTDVINCWNLKFVCTNDEHVYRNVFFSQRRFFGAVAASVELLATAVFLNKAAGRANLQDTAVRIIYNSTALIFMALTRAVPTVALLFARARDSPRVVLAYRLSRVPYASICVLFYMICDGRMGCSYIRGAWLDIFVFSLVLMPLFIQLPFAWHLPVQLVHMAATLMYTVGPASMCAPLHNTTLPSMPSVAAAPLMSLAQFLIARYPAIAKANMEGCAGNPISAADDTCTGLRCPATRQWFTAALQASSVVLHLLVPTPPSLASAMSGLSGTAASPAAHAPRAPMIDDDSWSTMQQHPCEAVSLLLLVGGGVLVTATLYWWELQSRLQWWQRQHSTVRLEPPLVVINLFVGAVALGVIIAAFVGTWCFAVYFY